MRHFVQERAQASRIVHPAVNADKSPPTIARATLTKPGYVVYNPDGIGRQARVEVLQIELVKEFAESPSLHHSPFGTAGF
jgi:hypothetical protein